MSDDDDVSLGELVRTMLRMEKKLDEVTGDHEKRLRDLERQNATLRGWLIGALCVGGLGGVTGVTALFGG